MSEEISEEMLAYFAFLHANILPITSEGMPTVASTFKRFLIETNRKYVKHPELDTIHTRLTRLEVQQARNHIHSSGNSGCWKLLTTGFPCE